MAENWRAGKAGYSSRKLSRVTVGLDAFSDFEQSLGTRPLVEQKSSRVSGNGSPDSKAKRLERAFNKLKRDGTALPVSVYLIHNAERYSVLGRQTGTVVTGPFFANQLQNPKFVKADKKALENIGRQLNISASEVSDLSRKGLEFLKEFQPGRFPPKRI